MSDVLRQQECENLLNLMRSTRNRVHHLKSLNQVVRSIILFYACPWLLIIITLFILECAKSTKEETEESDNFYDFNVSIVWFMLVSYVALLPVMVFHLFTRNQRNEVFEQKKTTPVAVNCYTSKETSNVESEEISEKTS